jgi:hypothetical protein
MSISGSPVVSETSSSVLTNKTINSAVNSLTITSSPVVNTNINSLINQDVRTTSSPIFAGVRLTGLAADNNGDRFMAIRADNVVVTRTNVLTTNDVQTITGIKTFQAAPVISIISNTGVLTLPTTTGTLALTSQIPTNSTYVDLTSNQTLTGLKTFNAGIRCTSILDNSGTNNVQINSDLAVNISNAVTLTQKTIVIDNQTSLVSTRSFGSMGNITPSSINLAVGANVLTLCTLILSSYSVSGRNFTVTGGNSLNDTANVLNKNYRLSYQFSGSYATNNQQVIAAIFANGVQVSGSLCYASAGNANNNVCISRSDISYQGSGPQSFQLYIGLTTAGTITQKFGHVSFKTVN